MLRNLPLLLAVAVVVWAAVECIQTPQPEVRNLPKLAWIAVILLLPFVGAVAWLFAGRPVRGGGGPGRPRPMSKPHGPDDDPDFLRRL